MSAPPWSSQRLREVFTPGRQVQVLLAGRRAWQHSAVRHASVLEALEDELILSQPQPALPPPWLGQALEITVLLRQAPGGQSRHAYQSSILDVLPVFDGPQGPGPAVVVMYPREEDLYPTSLRKARRLAVPSQAPLQLWLADQRLKLLDISQKGLRFSGGEFLSGYQPGQEMRLRLVVHDEPQRVHGRVAAINRVSAGREVSLELGILPLDAWTSLLEALQELEHAAQSQGAMA
ncbi:MAG: PilZ domain-containing protein [Pseudomonadota bacterium]